MEFGRRLQLLLEEQNLKQKDLAAWLHLASSTLSGYVSGTRQPSFETLIQIATYFGVTTDYLLGSSKLYRHAAAPLLPKEKLLLDLYRGMTEKQKALLLELARFCHYQSLREKNQKQN